jgi:hypothetical protein
MKIKLDENLPGELLDFILGLGHEADSVHSEGMAGFADAAVMSQVKRESRSFFTLDKGIADVRAYPPEDFAGLVLFRPRSSGRRAVFTFVQDRVADLLNRDLKGHLWVVTERGIRVR